MKTRGARPWKPGLAVAIALGAAGCTGAESGPAPDPGDREPGPEPVEAVSAELRSRDIQLTKLGTHRTNLFDQGAAENAAYDPQSRRVFSVNSTGRIDILDISDPTNPLLVGTTTTPGRPTSAAVHDGILAVSSVAPVRTDPGLVLLYRAATGELLATLTVGAGPDMLTFTPNGRFLLVANEGEPSDDYSVDPEGSVSVIAIGSDPRAVDQSCVRTARLDDSLVAGAGEGLRIFGLGAPGLARDAEPEYIAVAHDSRTAWVSLQENNAIAVLDVRQARFTRVVGLGFKDHSLAGNALDPSDRDGRIAIAAWPVRGMYQPDALASFRSGGKTYLITANEGDAREYPALTEEVRVRSLTLDPVAFPDATLRDNEKLGRLSVTRTLGDSDGDGDFDQLYAFGGRSVSIWTAAVTPLWDSGNALEVIAAEAFPANFNANNTANDFDSRSDNKGPEPEGVVVGKVAGRQYAFVGLERVGGVVIYDLSRPTAPRFVTYFNDRDFTATDPTAAGDLGPEGLIFVPGEDSPTCNPLLIVSNEVSGTTSILEITTL